MNKGRIVQVSKFYYPILGGQEIYIEQLNKVLEKNQFVPYVVQPHIFNKTPPINVIYTKPIPILYRLCKQITNFSWFIFNLELRLIAKKLKKFDVVISHYSFHINALKSLSNCIVVSHGVLWSENERNFFNSYLKKTDFSLSKRKKLTVVANDTDFLRRIGIDVPSSVIPFEEVKQNIWYIPNCINTDEFSIDPMVKREKIIFLPRNIRVDRGIHIAILAFVNFLEHDADFVLYIAGTPLNGDYFEYCTKIIEQNKLKEKVHFLGFTGKEEIKKLYQRSMLTLIPSLEKEGTSLSALESMSCGTPVVATNVGGLPDLPCVIATTNPEDISEKMVTVLNEWEKYSKIQRERVVTTFNLRNWENAWLSVIKSKI